MLTVMTCAPVPLLLCQPGRSQSGGRNTQCAERGLTGRGNGKVADILAEAINGEHGGSAGIPLRPKVSLAGPVTSTQARKGGCESSYLTPPEPEEGSESGFAFARSRYCRAKRAHISLS